MKVGRHHPDDFAADTLKLDGTPDDRSVTREVLLPEGMAEEDLVVLAGNILAALEHPSELRLCL
jgi:hypothetical protein